MCLDCSVLPSGICMTRVQFYELLFLSGAPGIIKFPVVPAPAMDWLTSIFIFDVLNRVS